MHLIVGVSLSQKTKKEWKSCSFWCVMWCLTDHSIIQNNNEKLKYNVVYYVMYFRYIFEFFHIFLKYFK
jgi:hypothetical protein